MARALAWALAAVAAAQTTPKALAESTTLAVPNATNASTTCDVIVRIGYPEGLAPCSHCAGASTTTIDSGNEPSICLPVEMGPERPQAQRAKWIFEPCAVEPSCAQELAADLRELRRTWGPDLGKTPAVRTSPTDSDRSSLSLGWVEA